MALYRGNGLGFLLSLGSVLLAVVAAALFDLATETAVFLIGGLMITLDLLVRWQSRKVAGWRKLISAKAGGQFVFLPVWGGHFVFANRVFGNLIWLNKA